MLLLEHVLKQVIQETYPDKKIYQDFTIRIVPKELKSKHGQYIQNDRKIEIYNLSRAPGANFLTALHEVAHHIEAMDFGETAHKETFYVRFYPLVCTALNKGYINQEDLLLDSQDSSDYKKLCHYYGSSFAQDYTEAKQRNTVVVSNAYNASVLLKRRDFSYLSGQYIWLRKFENEEQAIKEQKILESFNQNLDVRVVPVLDPIFIQTYYVAVPGAYQYREVLRKEGFIWNGYGFKSAWVKKLPSTDYLKVCSFLKEHRLTGKKVIPKMLSNN
ncbi:hypothetical protein EGW35_13205 [Enterococcus durans]|uniref:hypothetical protein n=1 Tax=Enterococcus TaxID=1350 RepID=UPI000F5081DF|nr:MULTISPECIES: hypothetical protein [Enterococcus]ROX80054.1 hypothetical protein EGW35_13205 [Enterococcus durans]TKN15855.1 hypothetical protein DVW83_11530 [Enterococcus sp. VV15]